MFSQKNRLRSRIDFEKVSRYGRFFSFGLISIKVLPNNLGLSRFGVSVGLKFSKKAVERNRVKRQAREVFRKNIDLIKTGFDIVIMAKPGPKKGISSFELENMLVETLKKASLIN